MRMTKFEAPNGKNVYVDLDSVVRVQESYDTAYIGGNYTELSLQNGSAQTVKGKPDNLIALWLGAASGETINMGVPIEVPLQGSKITLEVSKKT